jgi:hypothetical protein
MILGTGKGALWYAVDKERREAIHDLEEEVIAGTVQVQQLLARTWPPAAE